MKKYLGLASMLIATAVVPAVALAQGGYGSLGEALNTVRSLINALIPIIIGVAVLIFLWGLVSYVVAKDDEKRKEARNVIFTGIIILFVMLSVWGLVNFLRDTLRLDNAVPIAPPAVPAGF